MARIPPVIDEKSLDLLQTWYRSASRKIITDFNSVSEFNQARKAELLKQIGNNLDQLSSQTERWTNSNIKKAYYSGSNLAYEMLKALGIEDLQHTFGLIDEQAIKAIADETFLNFGTSFTGVLNASDRLFTDAIKQTIQARIAEGRILGETRKKISDSIAGQLKDGFIGMVDKSGKTWDIQVYARMLARTKIVESTNTGMSNELLKNGYDLVIVSNHNSDHQACRKWEGKILSITGKTEEYPSVEQAKSEGLFHPNCEHRLYPYHEDYSSVSKAWSSSDERKADFNKIAKEEMK